MNNLASFEARNTGSKYPYTQLRCPAYIAFGRPSSEHPPMMRLAADPAASTRRFTRVIILIVAVSEWHFLDYIIPPFSSPSLYSNEIYSCSLIHLMLVLAIPFLDGVHQVSPRSRMNGHFRKRPCGRRFSEVGWVDRDDRVDDLKAGREKASVSRCKTL